MAVRVCRGIRQSSPLEALMRRVHDTRRRPDITRIRLDVRSRDDIPAFPVGLQDPCGDEGTRKRLSGLPDRMVLPGKSRRAGDEAVDHPGAGGREAGSRVRFRPASGTGEPTHPDPAKAEGRATARGTGTDTNTAVIPSWPGPTSTIRRTAACRWTRRGAWSGTCPGPAGGLGRAAGGGRNTFGKSSGKATSGWPRRGSPTRARGTWRRRSGSP